jgi:hypothetical protein
MIQYPAPAQQAACEPAPRAGASAGGHGLFADSIRRGRPPGVRGKADLWCSVITLVMGASGHVGPHVVSALCARGGQDRVLVRDPVRALTLLPAGVELAEGDLQDQESVCVALDGVSAVFLLTPHGPSMAADQHRLIALDLKVTVFDTTPLQVGQTMRRGRDGLGGQAPDRDAHHVQPW